MVTTLGIFLGLYLIGMPILLRLVGVAHTKLVIQRAMEKNAKKRGSTKALPEPLWPKISERLKFTFKDKRPMKMGKKEGAGPENRIVFLGLWSAGLAAFLLAALSGKYALLGVGALLFAFSIVFGYNASKDILLTRKKVMRKMFEIGSSKLGLSPEDEFNGSVQVLEWEDMIKPKRVKYAIPTKFGMEGEDGFVKQFNQIFGSETAWVPEDDKETGAPGWNYDEGVVTLYAVPPLPRKAAWSERYVLDPAIAWSFFPIALGVENGVELTNPETGEVENVLGFDLSGEQAKVGEKAGVKVASKIVTSPMVLCGGGTGGGKSLPVDTLVAVPSPKTR